MRQLARHHLDATTLLAADERARRAPADRLPCPVCGAGLKGANLERHVTGKHADDHAAQRQGQPVQLGVDRRIRRWFWGLAVVWLGLEAAAVAADPDRFADSPLRSTEALSGSDVAEGLRDLATSPLGITLVGGVLLLVVLLVAVRVHAFRATITVTADGIRVRHRVGTGVLRVPFPAEIEVGQLYEVHGGNGDPSQYRGPRTEVGVGAYLRVAHGRRAVVIGCADATDVRTHWTGWQPGKRRKVWDVTLAPGPFVALQYALADAGQLTARTPSPVITASSPS